MKFNFLNKFNIGTQIIIVFFGLSLIICFTLSFIAYRSSSKATTELVNYTLEMKAGDAANEVIGSIKAMLQPMETLSRNDHIASMNWQQQLPILQEEAQKLGFQALGIVSPDGNLRQSDGRNSDISQRQYFKDAMAGKSSVSDPTVSNLDKSIVIMAAVPIKDGQGKVVGVMTGRSDYTALSNIVAGIKIGNTGYGYMINNAGLTIAHPNEEKVKSMENTLEAVKKDPSLASLAAIIKNMASGEKGYSSYEDSGVKMLVGFSPVQGTSWSVGVAQPEDEAMASLKSLRNNVILITAVLILICMVAGLIMGRYLGRPIMAAAKHCDLIAGGDFSKLMEETFVNRGDEIGALAKGFNKIVININEILKQLQHTSQHLLKSSQAMNALFQSASATMQQVSASTLQISSGLQNVSASTEEISASGEQMSASVSIVSDEAKGGASQATEIDKRAETMSKQVQTNRQNTYNVYENIRGKVIKAIEEAKIIEEISNLANSISNISEQTNLLALNAAIEAARAGEQGWGFAVVADEVRKLAAESSETVKNIHSLTGKVQVTIGELISNSQDLLDFISKDVTDGYDSMIEVSKQYQQDANIFLNLSNKTANASTEVLAAVEEISKALDSVAATITESAASSQEIVRSIEYTNKSMVEVTDAANQLAEEAAKMDEVVKQFKTLN
ncbi:MAG: methyl-accepting chemotaxis protein [Firmicutes bacterium]|nr:methyl-accepting chemotaxis protein [Bacillota bacterium]